MIPGCGGHDHARDIEHGSDLSAVERARPAEGNQREVARIEPLLHGARPDRVRHIRVQDGQHTLGGRDRLKVELAGELRDDAFCGSQVECHLPGEEVLRIESPEHEVRIGHGWLAPALGVRRRAGRQACTAPTDVEGAALVDRGDRAASASDRRDLERRHEHRIACDPRVARERRALLTVNDDADVGARTAHIECDQPVELRERTCPGAAENACAGPDMSVMIGRSAAACAVATPPWESMMCRSPATPDSAIPAARPSM